MGAHVLVPVKRLDAAKSRLAKALPPLARAQLMEELLAHVLAVVREAEVGPVTVVSPEPVEQDGIEHFDDGGLPWNDALASAMHAVVREPVVAVIAGDLPLLCAAEVETFIRSTPARGLAIGRARDGGTNAVAMRPPAVLGTCFGEPGSAALHERAAWTAGVDAHVLDLPGLAFDVDTPEDLAAWR